MPHEILNQEVNSLAQNGYSIELIEDGGFENIVIKNYAVPPIYNKQNITLLLRFPISYPNGKPDMFWVDEDLLLKDGRTPNRADQIEKYLGISWRRFSWHLTKWDPASGNLKMYLEFVNLGLNRAAEK